MSISSSSDVRNNPERLAEVARSGLLGSPPEECFDRVTRMAMRITGAPIAFFAVVAADHDFYKSCIGLSEPFASRSRFTLNSLCHLAIAQDRPLVIADTLTLPERDRIVGINDTGLRSFLAIPLHLNGQCIGSFCMADTQPRPWDPEQIDILREFGESLMREVRVRLERERADGFIATIASIQEKLLSRLRDPLTVVQLNADLLSDIVREEAGHDHLRMIHGAVARMEEGIRSLLEAARNRR